MIKELIKDLTFDNINLEQALTRAKLIAYKIGDEKFKSWIATELNGYLVDDELPDYRIIRCEIFGVVEIFGGQRIVPFDLSILDKDLKGELYIMRLRQSVSILEESVNEATGPFGDEDFPIPLVSMVRDITKINGLVGVKKRIQFTQLRHILNLTKQKLLDTLLDLDQAFPNLENEFNQTEANRKITRTIITNHIYGDNSSSNIGVGENISQTIANAYAQKIDKVLSELKDLGIEDKDLNEVKEIVTKETDKNRLGKRLMSWSGKIASKAIEKGIDLKLPIVLEKIQELM